MELAWTAIAVRPVAVSTVRRLGSLLGQPLPHRARFAAPNHALDHPRRQVKVAFGSVWKQSLLELSGGQRSLVALSLVLSLLRFKPAPVYILDEIDAALDLSHTQNIGMMIRA